MTFKTSALGYVAAAVLSLTASSAVFADTFSWVDSNGIVNYSERMPRGIPVERVTRVRDNTLGPSSVPTEPITYTPAPSSTPGSTPTAARQEGLSESQQQMLAQLQSAEVERQAMVAQVRKDNCERSKRVLRNLSNIGRVRVTAEDGTNSVMAEDDRKKRINDAQKGIAANC